MHKFKHNSRCSVCEDSLQIARQTYDLHELRAALTFTAHVSTCGLSCTHTHTPQTLIHKCYFTLNLHVMVVRTCTSVPLDRVSQQIDGAQTVWLVIQYVCVCVCVSWPCLIAVFSSVKTLKDEIRLWLRSPHSREGSDDGGRKSNSNRVYFARTLEKKITWKKRLD